MRDPEPIVGPAQMRAWTAFLTAHSRIIRGLDRELRELGGATLSEYDVMVQLSSAPEGGMRMGELARSVLVTESGLTRLVDRFVQRGWATRTPSPDDRRMLFCQLTTEGRDELERLRPIHHAGIDRMFAGALDEESAAQLERLLASLPACGGAVPDGNGDCPDGSEPR